MTDTKKYERLTEYPLRDVLEVPSSYGAVQSQPLATGENKPPQQTILLSALDQFKHIPIDCICSHCQQRVITRVEKRSGALSWLLCGGSVFLGCWLGCCLIPFCVKGLKNTLHFCPNCGKMLAEAKHI